MKISKILTFCLPLLCAVDAYSQDVVPAPPSASGIVSQVNIPVNLSTGIANIQVPLVSLLHNNGVDLPVTLSYSTRGIKVQDVAGPVGLGWTLNAGGAITRVVMGLPDEDQNFLLPSTNADYQSIAEGDKDGERDVFYFSWPGGSGKFVGDCINPDGTYKPCEFYSIPYREVKIEKFGSLQNKTATWIITDEIGTKYHYTVREKLIVNQMTEFEDYDESNERKYTSTWYLSKIDFLNTPKDITLEYETGTTYDYEYYNKYCETEYSGYAEDFYTDCLSTNTLIEIYKPKYLKRIKSSQGEVVFDWKVGEYRQVGDNGIFEDVWYPARRDIGDTYLIGVSLVDLKGNEVVTNSLKHQTATSNLVNGLHSFPGGGNYLSLSEASENTERLQLTEVLQNGMSIRRFKYIRNERYQLFPGFPWMNPTILPPRNSVMFDHYGYFNGETFNDALDSQIQLPDEVRHPNVTRLSKVGIEIRESRHQEMPLIGKMVFWGNAGREIGFLSRTPFEPYAVAGSLYQIIYPSGGIEELEYSIPEGVYYGEEPGGLVISKITKKFDTNAEQISSHIRLEKQFIYSNPVIGGSPRYNSIFRQKNNNIKLLSAKTLGEATLSGAFYLSDGSTVLESAENLPDYSNQSNSGFVAITNAVSFTNLFDLNGTITEYGSVEVIDFDGTRSVHEFYNSDQAGHGDERADIEYRGYNIDFNMTYQDFIPYPPRTTRFWKRGMPSSTITTSTTESSKSLYDFDFDAPSMLSLQNNKVTYTVRYDELPTLSKLYNRIFGSLGGSIVPDRDDLFVIGKYDYDITPIVPTQSISNQYILGIEDPVSSSVTSFSYDTISPLKLKEARTVSPDGSESITRNRYISDLDFSSGSSTTEKQVFEFIENSNASNIPIETQVFVKENGVETFVSSSFNTYKKMGNEIYPYKQYQLIDVLENGSLDVDFDLNGNLDVGQYELMTELNYDLTTGNLMQKTDRAGITSTYSYSSDNLVEDVISDHGIHEFTSHYEHNPLVGVKSIRDINGQKIQYEYDRQNRLRLTRKINSDESVGDIMKRYSYHLATDPADIVNSDALFNYLSTGCVGGIEFTTQNNSNFAGATSYIWEFGDGTLKTTNTGNVTHPYPSTGIYWVKLTVSNPEYESTGFYSREIDVEVGDLYTEGILLQGLGITYSSVEFNVNKDFCGISTYTWDFGDGTTEQTQDVNSTHTYASAGTYTVDLTISNPEYEEDYLYSRVITISDQLFTAAVCTNMSSFNTYTGVYSGGNTASKCLTLTPSVQGSTGNYSTTYSIAVGETGAKCLEGNNSYDWQRSSNGTSGRVSVGSDPMYSTSSWDLNSGTTYFRCVIDRECGSSVTTSVESITITTSDPDGGGGGGLKEPFEY